MEDDELQRCIAMSLLSDEELINKVYLESLNDSSNESSIETRNIKEEQDRLYQESLQKDKYEQKQKKRIEKKERKKKRDLKKFDKLHKKQLERVRLGEKVYTKIIIRYKNVEETAHVSHVTIPFFEDDILLLLYKMISCLLHDKSFFLYNAYFKKVEFPNDMHNHTFVSLGWKNGIVFHASTIS